MREMILADTKEHRKEALAKILPYQREDFIGMFKELKDIRRRSGYLILRCMNSCPTRVPNRAV